MTAGTINKHFHKNIQLTWLHDETYQTPKSRNYSSIHDWLSTEKVQLFGNQFYFRPNAFIDWAIKLEMTTPAIKLWKEMFQSMHVLKSSLLANFFKKISYCSDSHGGTQARESVFSTDPDPGTCFGGYLKTLCIYVCVCFYTIEVPSLNRFLSYLVHKLVLGAVKNGKIISWIENRKNRVFINVWHWVRRKWSWSVKSF